MFTVEIMQKIIQEETSITINKIGANIFMNGITWAGINRNGQNISGGKTGQNASGKTIQSLRGEDKGDALAIYGRDKFSQLETGTPPNSGVTMDTIYQWSKFKGIPFKNDKSRFWFSHSASNSINEKGTLLFQLGGRKDVYTNEIEPLSQRLTQRITEQIMTTKLVEEIASI